MIHMRTIIHAHTICSVFGIARAFTGKTDFSFLRLNQIKITSIFVSQLVWRTWFDPIFGNQIRARLCLLSLLANQATVGLLKHLARPACYIKNWWRVTIPSLCRSASVNDANHMNPLYEFPSSKNSNTSEFAIQVFTLYEFPSSKNSFFERTTTTRLYTAAVYGSAMI